MPGVKGKSGCRDNHREARQMDDWSNIMFRPKGFMGYYVRVSCILEPTDEELAEAYREGTEMPSNTKELILQAWLLSRNEFVTFRRYALKWIERCHTADHCHYVITTYHYTGSQGAGGSKHAYDYEHIEPSADYDQMIHEIHIGDKDYEESEKNGQDCEENISVAMERQKNGSGAEDIAPQSFKKSERPKKARKGK